MLSKRPLAILILLFLAISAGNLQAHEGVDHGAAGEIHPHRETLLVGPQGRYRVTLAYLPDTPQTDQKTQMLLGLEEDLGSDDPLLGGVAPFAPKAFQVWATPEEGSRTQLDVQEESELGTYRVDYSFPWAGSWRLTLEFGDEAGERYSGEFVIPLEEAPGNWFLLAFQAMVLLAGFGLVVQKLRASPTASSLAYVLIVFCVGGATLFLVQNLWPGEDLGILEISALHTPEPQAAGSSGSDFAPRSVGEAPRLEANRRMFIGTVQNALDRVAQIRSPLPGTVVFKDRVPQIGDRVQPGQILAVIQNEFNVHDYSHLLNVRWELMKILMETSEMHVQAEAEYQRAASLLDLGIISQREFSQNELAFHQAKTAHEKAQEKLNLHDSQLRRSNLHETPLVSPIAGTISSVNHSAGQMIYEDDFIFEIVDLSVVWVETFAPPEALARLESASHVTLHSNALGEDFTGTLVGIRPDVDQQSKTVRVLYKVSNPDWWLKPGMLMDVYPESEDIQRVAREDGPSKVGG